MPILTDPTGDVTHATSAAADLFAAYHRAKSSHDVAATMTFFSRDKVVYSDAVLGWQWPSHAEIEALFEQYMPNWGEGVSYATRVIGDETSAVVFVTDSPELFGGEIRTISAVDLEGGEIVRFVDYWDGRAFGSDAAAQMRTPADAFPQTYGEEQTPSRAAEPLRAVVERLSGALRGGEAEAAMFGADAALEDLTLRTTVRGRAAIERYLRRAAAQLPWGAGSSVRHVVGSEQGGGYEWINPAHAAPRGISALELDDTGAISRLSVMWDGSLVDNAEFARLQGLAAEG